MSKFNATKPRQATKTLNHEGGIGYTKTVKTELVQLLACSFLEPQYYVNASQQAQRLVELAGKVNDPEFLAKAAIFTRTRFGMRSSAQLLAAAVGPHRLEGSEGAGTGGRNRHQYACAP